MDIASSKILVKRLGGADLSGSASRVQKSYDEILKMQKRLREERCSELSSEVSGITRNFSFGWLFFRGRL